MVISVDTSFLFSLYGNDCNTARSITWCKQNPRPIAISPLNRFELLNSLRFAEFRKALKPGEASAHQLLFRNAIDSGRLIEHPCSLSDTLSEATLLSAAHAVSGGHRSFDILHVAAARVMNATHFLTFDAKQTRLAKAAGLKTPLQ
jgi:predicted nucleic acid-binding protein